MIAGIPIVWDSENKNAALVLAHQSGGIEHSHTTTIGVLYPFRVSQKPQKGKEIYDTICCF
jgi:hypothetical protein